MLPLPSEPATPVQARTTRDGSRPHRGRALWRGPVPRGFALLGLAWMLVAGFAAPAAAVCPTFGLPSGSEIVEFQTSEGQICFELLRSEAPVTVWNFLNYVIGGDYDGVMFHRSVPGFVIQGGGFAPTSDSVVPIPVDAQIINEPCTIIAPAPTCTERGNERGTLAMARLGGQINSATNQFFINLADNRNPLDIVDQGFTVFANVLGSGMTVADDIAALPIGNPDESWWLAPQIGSVLGELPLSNAVPFSQNTFGCWDPLDLALVVDPQSHTTGLPDPFFGTVFYPLSGACGTQIPRFSFTEDPGPPECPDNDILTTAVSGLTSLGIKTDPATMDFLQYEFTCLETAEAVIQRDLFRDDYGSRVVPQLVTIQSASYQVVPEPGLSALLVFGAGGLVGLARRRRPRLG